MQLIFAHHFSMSPTYSLPPSVLTFSLYAFNLSLSLLITLFQSLSHSLSLLITLFQSLSFSTMLQSILTDCAFILASFVGATNYSMLFLMPQMDAIGDQ